MSDVSKRLQVYKEFLHSFILALVSLLTLGLVLIYCKYNQKRYLNNGSSSLQLGILTQILKMKRKCKWVLFLFFLKNMYNKTKAKDKYFPLNTSTCEHCQLERYSDLSQFSNTTVRSWSSSLMLIVAIAPSLNSKEVPPSTTMQASQQRERTHNLKAEKKKNPKRSKASVTAQTHRRCALPETGDHH